MYTLNRLVHGIAIPEACQLMLQAAVIGEGGRSASWTWASRPVSKPTHLKPGFSGCETVGGAVEKDLLRRGICLASSTSLTAQEQLHLVNAAGVAAVVAPLDKLCAAVLAGERVP